MWLYSLLTDCILIAHVAGLSLQFSDGNCTHCYGYTFACSKHLYNKSEIAKEFSKQCKLTNTLRYDTTKECDLTTAVSRRDTEYYGLYHLHYYDIYYAIPGWAVEAFINSYDYIFDSICKELERHKYATVVCGVYQQDDLLGAYVGDDGRYLYCLFK